MGEDCSDARLPALTKGQANFVLTDENVFALYPDFFKKYFSGAEIFVMNAGEEYKNFTSLQAILEKMVGAGLKRTSRLFAVGGGVVGDMGGLCASLYMRGISCVQIPTTLLSQVDSSVGGKTAIDVCGVKNVVGAFYQPQEVLIDPNFLKTLPPREWKCGLGEIVKYAALDGDFFETMYQNKENLSSPQLALSLVYDSVALKAGVVMRDEKETGERKCLNVGHTTGHAIELAFGLSHGESVLWGMKLETKIAMATGVCEKEYGQKLLAIVEAALALPPVGKIDLVKIGEAAQNASADKKNVDSKNIVMAVAKAKGEWTILSLVADDYKTALERAARKE